MCYSEFVTYCLSFYYLLRMLGFPVKGGEEGKMGENGEAGGGKQSVRKW